MSIVSTPKQLSLSWSSPSSSSFPLQFEFRSVLIYLQPLVYIIYLCMQIFGGKLRPVAAIRLTLVYAYRPRDQCRPT